MKVCGEDQACLLCLALGSLLPSPHHFTKNCEFFLSLLVLFLLTVSLCASIHHDWALVVLNIVSVVVWFSGYEFIFFPIQWWHSGPQRGGVIKAESIDLCASADAQLQMLQLPVHPVGCS